MFGKIKRNWKITIPVLFTVSALSFVSGVIFYQTMLGNAAYSQTNGEPDSQLVKSLFNDVNFYIALFLGVAGVIGSLGAFSVWVKKSVNKDNKDALGVMNTKLDLTVVSLTNKMDGINLNMQTNANNNKDILNEIKNKLDKVEGQRDVLIKHDGKLEDHDRRLNNLENHQRE